MKETELCADDVRIACPLFQAECGGEVPTSALQLMLYRVSMPTAQNLNALWHSVLPETDLSNLVRNAHYIAYAAEYSNVYYAVAIWTDPIAGNRLTDGSETLELRRFAIADDAPRFTASRMLSVMKKLLKKQYPEIKKLVSYQAIEHHDGTIYKASGWTPANRSKAEIWHVGKSRAPMQTESDKIRWEIDI